MKNKTVKRLLSYLLKYKNIIIFIILSALVSNVLLIIGPLLTGRAINYIVGLNQVDFHEILRIILFMGGLYGVGFIFQWLLSVLTTIIANKTVKDLREETFNKISTLPLQYYDRNAHGDIISRLTNDIDFIAEGLIQGVTQLISGVITILGSMIFMFIISPILTVVVLALTPLCFLITSFIAKMSKKMFAEQSSTLGELNGYIAEYIGNQKIVKAFSYEQRSQERFEEINQRLYHCGKSAQFYSSLTNPSTRFINNLTYILSGVIGGVLALFRGLSIGDISSFLIYSNQFAKPINEITSITTQLQAAIASAERVFAVLDQMSESSDLQLGDLAISKGTVEFKQVSFSYRPEVPLIQNLNLRIQAGSSVAIVGPTGAGKTTLVNLLMRFYDLNEGQILVDHQDIATIKRNSLRKNFGMVLQETWLYTASIRENIAYGKPEATLEEVIQAAKGAYAHEFINMLPDGYDTIISEEGGSLSQGQKQLLTIARVMLIDPLMLILDEATSSIDTLTEARIQKAFNKLMKGRTSFIIAHRLSTIKEADMIIVMKDGNIIETGSHDVLMNKKGFYENLYNSQFEIEA